MRDNIQLQQLPQLTVEKVLCEINSRTLSVGLVGSEPCVEGRFPKKVCFKLILSPIVDWILSGVS